MVRSGVGSAVRIAADKKEVAAGLADKRTRDALKQVKRPNSVSGTLRKAGVALILAPDPITAVPGVVMLGASVAAGRKKPLSSDSVYEEAQQIISELDSLF
ncbi:MAG: hypothetical protein JRN03_02355 [Nitrososphaerota archaeon]|nr:hypothetical protein [Nitrososphaerota archaeon]MDG6966543.1 hypothetical protein [Nitrososphaerota archaeon]